MSDISTSGPAYRVVNPATGEVVETFEYATDGEIEEALAAVQTAYGAWREVPIAERAKTVKRIGELFVERRGELAAIATEEMGKPLGEARGEAKFCGEIFDYFATEGPELAADLASLDRLRQMAPVVDRHRDEGRRDRSAGRVRTCRCAFQLWRRYRRPVPPCGRVCRFDPEGT